MAVYAVLAERSMCGDTESLLQGDFFRSTAIVMSLKENVALT